MSKDKLKVCPFCRSMPTTDDEGYIKCSGHRNDCPISFISFDSINEWNAGNILKPQEAR